MDKNTEMVQILEVIRDNQDRSFELQRKALAIQQEQFEMAKRQFDRAEALQDRAEKIQDAGASMMRVARKSLIILLPVIFVLVAYLSWLILR